MQPSKASQPQAPAWNALRVKTIARDIFAGTMAGIVVTLVGHPFDTLKVRLQTQPQNPPVYNGLLDCFRKTMKWEGIGGLYKGVSSPLAGQIFFRANMFLSFAEAKRFLSGYGTRPLEKHHYFMAGSFAWFTGTAFECPIDLFKSQMQFQIIKSKSIPGYVSPYKNIVDCAKQVISQRGITGAYQGVVPHLMRNIPAGAVHLGLFENLRIYFAKKQGVTVPQLPQYYTLVAGATGGFFFWFLFFPFDVIKSAIQTDAINPADRKFHGVVDCSRKLWAEGGAKRFYRGFSPCLLRSLPANALMLWTVAFITERLQVK